MFCLFDITRRSITAVTLRRLCILEAAFDNVTTDKFPLRHHRMLFAELQRASFTPTSSHLSICCSLLLWKIHFCFEFFHSEHCWLMPLIFSICVKMSTKLLAKQPWMARPEVSPEKVAFFCELFKTIFAVSWKVWNLFHKAAMFHFIMCVLDFRSDLPRFKERESKKPSGSLWCSEWFWCLWSTFLAFLFALQSRLFTTVNSAVFGASKDQNILRLLANTRCLGECILLMESVCPSICTFLSRFKRSNV